MSNEKDRKLTAAEEKRMSAYNALSDKLAAEGYRSKELTVGLVKANLFAILLALPVIGICVYLFYRNNQGKVFPRFSLKENIIFILVFLLSIVIHELIHGGTWGIFADNHLKDIDFGFIKEYLTPYCTCKSLLRKIPYLLGTAMPLIILGIIPTVIAILFGSSFLLWYGILMILSAGGDILIILQLLLYKSNFPEKLYLDHPTQAGLVVFER